jgi:alpha-D-ribose 1-methylphosphonate 5-phosphate C-P lyase
VRNLKTIKNKTSNRFLNRHCVPHFEMTLRVDSVISNPCPEPARELREREKSHSYHPKEKIDFSVATLPRNDRIHFIGHFELTEGSVRNLKTIKTKTSNRFLNRHYVPHFEMTLRVDSVISNPCPEPARELREREKSQNYQKQETSLDFSIVTASLISK